MEEIKDRLALLEDDVRALNQSMQSGSKLGLALRRTKSPTRSKGSLLDGTDSPGAHSVASSGMGAPARLPGHVADRQVGGTLPGSLMDDSLGSLRHGAMVESLQQLQLNSRLGQLSEQIEMAVVQIAEERTQRRMEVSEAKLRLDAMEESRARDEVASQSSREPDVAEAHMLTVAKEATSVVDAAKSRLEELARAEADRAVAEIRSVLIEERPTLIVGRHGRDESRAAETTDAAAAAAAAASELKSVVSDLEARLSGRVATLETQISSGAAEARALVADVGTRLSDRFALMEVQCSAEASSTKALVRDLESQLAGRITSLEAHGPNSAVDLRALASRVGDAEIRLAGRVASEEALKSHVADLESRLAGLAAAPEARDSPGSTEATALTSDLESRFAGHIAALEAMHKKAAKEQSATGAAEIGARVAELDARLVGRIAALEEKGHVGAAESAALLSDLELRLAGRISSLEEVQRAGTEGALKFEARLKKEEGRLAELLSMVTIVQEDKISSLEQRIEVARAASTQESAAEGEALRESALASAQISSLEQSLDAKVLELRGGLDSKLLEALAPLEQRLSAAEASCEKLFKSASQKSMGQGLETEATFSFDTEKFAAFAETAGETGSAAAAAARAEASAAEASVQAAAAKQAAESAKVLQDALRAALATAGAEQPDSTSSARQVAEHFVMQVGARVEAKLGFGAGGSPEADGEPRQPPAPAPPPGAESRESLEGQLKVAETRLTALLDAAEAQIGAALSGALEALAERACSESGAGAARAQDELERRVVPRAAKEALAALQADVGAEVARSATRLDAVERALQAEVRSEVARGASRLDAMERSLQAEVGAEVARSASRLDAVERALQAVPRRADLDSLRLQIGPALDAAALRASSRSRSPRTGEATDIQRLSEWVSCLDGDVGSLRVMCVEARADSQVGGAALRKDVDQLCEERAGVRQHLEVLQAQADSQRAAADAERSRVSALAEGVRQSGDEHGALKRRLEEVAHSLDVERLERQAKHQSLSDSIEATLLRLLRKMDDSCALLGRSEPGTAEGAAARGRAAERAAGTAVTQSPLDLDATSPVSPLSASPVSAVRPLLRACAAPQPSSWAGTASAPTLPRALASLADDLAVELSAATTSATARAAASSLVPSAPAAPAVAPSAQSMPPDSTPSAAPVPTQSQPSPQPIGSRSASAKPSFRVLSAASVRRPSPSRAPVALAAGSPVPTARLVAAEPVQTVRARSPQRHSRADRSPCHGASPLPTRSVSPVRQPSAASRQSQAPVPVNVSILCPPGVHDVVGGASAQGAATAQGAGGVHGTAAPLPPDERNRYLWELQELREMNHCLREERIREETVDIREHVLHQRTPTCLLRCPGADGTRFATASGLRGTAATPQPALQSAAQAAPPPPAPQAPQAPPPPQAPQAAAAPTAKLLSSSAVSSSVQRLSVAMGNPGNVGLAGSSDDPAGCGPWTSGTGALGRR